MYIYQLIKAKILHQIPDETVEYVDLQSALADDGERCRFPWHGGQQAGGKDGCRSPDEQPEEGPPEVKRRIQVGIIGGKEQAVAGPQKIPGCKADKKGQD